MPSISHENVARAASGGSGGVVGRESSRDVLGQEESPLLGQEHDEEDEFTSPNRVSTDMTKIRRVSRAVPEEVNERRFAQPYAWGALAAWWAVGGIAAYVRRYFWKMSITSFSEDVMVRQLMWGQVRFSLPVAIVLSLIIGTCERSVAKDREKGVSLPALGLSFLLTGPASAFIQMAIFDIPAKVVRMFRSEDEFLELLAGLLFLNFVESHVRHYVFNEMVYPIDCIDPKLAKNSILPALSVALSLVWTGTCIFMYNSQDNIFAVVLANMVNEVVWAYAVRLQFVWSIRQKRAYRSSGRRPKEA